MRTDSKIKKNLNAKERQFFDLYGVIPTSQQLRKFNPPTRVKLYNENLAHKLAKSVPADRSVWRKRTYKSI